MKANFGYLITYLCIIIILNIESRLGRRLDGAVGNVCIGCAGIPIDASEILTFVTVVLITE